MLVTLDTSKRSGWLNTDAPCRVTRGGMGSDMRGERQECVGRWRCKQRGREDELNIEDKACAGRTANIWFMSVTLDASKLSGWLNADASWRVKSRAYNSGRCVRDGWREGVMGWHARGGPD